MSTINNPLQDIYYISIPESFSGNFESFIVDKSIKLPIETNGIENWNPETLSWEMIISAMLKIMAYDLENPNLEYYRNFVFAVRPNIINELTDSAIFKSSEYNFSLAKEIFLAIRGLDPNNDRNILNMAVLYDNESDWFKRKGDNSKEIEFISKAKDIYLELLDKDSVLTDTYLNAGYFFIKIRDFEKAELCLNAFIEYSDDENKIIKAKKVLTEYNNILSNEDIFSSVYNLILAEKESEAIEKILEYLNDNKNIWNAWFLLGWAYRRLSSFSEAIIALNEVLNLNKKDVDTYNELAICYMETGDFTKSQKSLEKALSLNPEDVKIISNMGIVQIKMGNIETAIKYFETVLVYDEEDTIAKMYLEQLK